MKDAVHERARMLIALGGPESMEESDCAWLSGHLESCEECREFADASAEAVRMLRAVPISAGWSLVSATRSRLRQRALELQRQRERLWVATVCCAAVTLCTLLTTAALWGGLAWLARETRVISPLWQMLLLAANFMPALFAAVLLLARGIHLSDRTWEG